MNRPTLTSDYLLTQAGEIIDRALAEHSPAHVFLMLSGGNDSLSTTHFTASHLKRPFRVLHINTGIGIPETRDHVYAVCAQYQWELVEVRAKEDCGQDYEALVMKYGFPGPPQHNLMYRRLKERCLEKLARDFDGRLMLVSGARLQESAKRMRLTSTEIKRVGRRVWCSPFFYLDNEQLSAYREASKIPESPVRKLLCMSGECLCGSYAKEGELKEIEFFFPRTGAYLRDLQRRVRAAGFPWDWDERRPRWFDAMKNAEKAGQADAFGQELSDEMAMLCTSCQFKSEVPV